MHKHTWISLHRYKTLNLFIILVIDMGFPVLMIGVGLSLLGSVSTNLKYVICTVFITKRIIIDAYCIDDINLSSLYICNEIND